MKIVQFTRHNAPFVAGERASFDPLSAEHMRKRGVARIVGSVDDNGRLVLDVETEGPSETPDAGDGDHGASVGSGAAPRRGRQG